MPNSIEHLSDNHDTAAFTNKLLWKRKNIQSQSFYCRYFVWQLLSCCWEVEKSEERGGEFIYSDNTYCYRHHFFYKFCQQHENHYWSGIKNAFNVSSHRKGSSKIQRVCEFSGVIFTICVWRKKETSLWWFCSHKSSKGEGTTQQLSILAQPAVHIIDLVTCGILKLMAFSTTHFINPYVW